jgi:hypothetical protein
MPRLSIFQDTIVKLDWTNPATDYDSIFIERKTSVTATYKQIAALKGNAITFSDLKLPQNKEYFYRVIAHYNSNSDLYSYPQKIFLPTYVPKPPVLRQLFTGQPIEIPGRLEAENFDIGEDGMTYHDSDTKNVTGAWRPTEPIDIYDLGNNKYYVIDNYPGEWLEYTVNVAKKGLYDISASIAAVFGGGTFSIKIGSTESDVIKAPATNSWVTTKMANFSMNLEAGTQIMRLTFIEKPLFYIDFIDFTRVIPDGFQPVSSENLLSITQNQREITISSAKDQPIETCIISNILGSVVKTIKATESKLWISTQEFNSGIYIIQAISGKQKLSKKIVIP